MPGLRSFGSSGFLKSALWCMWHFRGFPSGMVTPQFPIFPLLNPPLNAASQPSNVKPVRLPTTLKDIANGAKHLTREKQVSLPLRLPRRFTQSRVSHSHRIPSAMRRWSLARLDLGRWTPQSLAGMEPLAPPSQVRADAIVGREDRVPRPINLAGARSRLGRTSAQWRAPARLTWDAART